MPGGSSHRQRPNSACVCLREGERVCLLSIVLYVGEHVCYLRAVFPRRVEGSNDLLIKVFSCSVRDLHTYAVMIIHLGAPRSSIITRCDVEKNSVTFHKALAKDGS